MKFKNCEFLFTTNKLSGCNVYLIFGLNSDQKNLKNVLKMYVKNSVEQSYPHAVRPDLIYTLFKDSFLLIF